MDIVFVVGTRPQFIKLASLVRAFNKHGIEYGVIHTGQHYDYEMNRIFFEELGLPEPIAYLGVGSGSHGEQTGKIIIGAEKKYLELGVKLAVIPGDTNSALASGLAGVKIGVDIVHVEAGLRSFEYYMAEEINRRVLDHISSLLFPPTDYAYMNLLKEGIDFSKIYLVGDVMYDNILLFRDKIEEAVLPSCVDDEYIYITCHRAENVDYPDRLNNIVKALLMIASEGYRIVFPMHPRTRNRLKEYGLYDKLDSEQNICLLKPVSYFTSLKLARNAIVTITDSGGLQKESFILGTPVITIRNTTEWIETVEYGWNTVIGYGSNKLYSVFRETIDNPPKPVSIEGLYGDGKASHKIAIILKKYLE